MSELTEGIAATSATSSTVETWVEPGFRASWLRWNPDAGDGVHALYRPDACVPELSFEHLRRTTARSPEGRLILAILDDAVLCYRKHAFASRARHRRLFREAEFWLFANGRAAPTKTAFSCNYICDALGIDSRALREALAGWRTRRTEQLRAGYSPNGERAAA